jgi:hypothetical protein
MGLLIFQVRGEVTNDGIRQIFRQITCPTNHSTHKHNLQNFNSYSWRELAQADVANKGLIGSTQRAI